MPHVQRHTPTNLPSSDQPQRAQLGQHVLGQRQHRRPSRDRAAPPLAPDSASPGTAGTIATGSAPARVNLDQAIAAAILVPLAAKPGDQLAHPDLAADDPVDRAAGEHLRRRGAGGFGYRPSRRRARPRAPPAPGADARYRRCRPRVSSDAAASARPDQDLVALGREGDQLGSLFDHVADREPHRFHLPVARVRRSCAPSSSPR